MYQHMINPKIECEVSTETFGRFVAEPLESGFGTTLGNALRRVLLSSLPGVAITWIKIDQVEHEFSVIPSVKEDAQELILNLKGVRLRGLSDRPGRLYLDIQREGAVTAADIQETADYEVVNKDHYLATLDSIEARLTIEMNVEPGSGWVTSGSRDGLPIGVIPIDAIFTPIRKVNYSVENTRIGQFTNYDRLVLDIWTDGTIGPGDALSQAAQILIRQFTPFAEFGKAAAVSLERFPLGGATLPEDRLQTPIEELALSVRAYNCLRRAGITKVGEVLAMTEEELLAVKNFGRKSLDELRERLADHGFLVEGGEGVEGGTTRLRILPGGHAGDGEEEDELEEAFEDEDEDEDGDND